MLDLYQVIADWVVESSCKRIHSNSSEVTKIRIFSCKALSELLQTRAEYKAIMESLMDDSNSIIRLHAAKGLAFYHLNIASTSLTHHPYHLCSKLNNDHTNLNMVSIIEQLLLKSPDHLSNLEIESYRLLYFHFTKHILFSCGILKQSPIPYHAIATLMRFIMSSWKTIEEKHQYLGFQVISGILLGSGAEILDCEIESSSISTLPPCDIDVLSLAFQSLLLCRLSQFQFIRKCALQLCASLVGMGFTGRSWKPDYQNLSKIYCLVLGKSQLLRNSISSEFKPVDSIDENEEIRNMCTSIISHGRIYHEISFNSHLMNTRDRIDLVDTRFKLESHFSKSFANSGKLDSILKPDMIDSNMSIKVDSFRSQYRTSLSATALKFAPTETGSTRQNHHKISQTETFKFPPSAADSIVLKLDSLQNQIEFMMQSVTNTPEPALTSPAKLSEFDQSLLRAEFPDPSVKSSSSDRQHDDRSVELRFEELDSKKTEAREEEINLDAFHNSFKAELEESRMDHYSIERLERTADIGNEIDDAPQTGFGMESLIIQPAVPVSLPFLKKSVIKGLHLVLKHLQFSETSSPVDYFKIYEKGLLSGPLTNAVIRVGGKAANSSSIYSLHPIIKQMILMDHNILLELIPGIEMYPMNGENDSVLLEQWLSGLVHLHLQLSGISRVFFKFESKLKREILLPEALILCRDQISMSNLASQGAISAEKLNHIQSSLILNMNETREPLGREQNSFQGSMILFSTSFLDWVKFLIWDGS